MSKQHRDFVVFVRNGVNINALVAYSRDVVTPATQTVPQSSEEHLTLVYLDPQAANAGVLATGEQLRNSIAIAFDVAPVSEGRANGWTDAGDGGAFQSRSEGEDTVPERKFSALQEELGRKDEMLREAEDLLAQYKAAAAAVPSSEVVQNDPAVVNAASDGHSQ